MINQEDREQVKIRDESGIEKKWILREWNLDEQHEDNYEDENEDEDS